jgi:predicted O-methyltransferase YrrM
VQGAKLRVVPKLKTALRVVREILRNPRRLTRVIDPTPPTPREAIQNYFNRPPALPQIDLLDLFSGLDETISPYSYLEGQAMPTDIALLKGLARQRPGCRYLEIGSWRGESLANVATVCAECVAITLSAAEMRDAGYPESAIACEGFFSRGVANVRFIERNSRTFDFRQFGRYFDLIFVDGDHSPEAVRDDTRAAFSVLRNENSVIVWHDYALTPESVNWPTLEGIRKGLPPDKLDSVFHISNTLCAAFFGNTPFAARPVPFPQMPDKTFDIRLRGRHIEPQRLKTVS